MSLEVLPFSAVRFASRDGDVSRFIAPPYDVLDQNDKNALFSRCDRNIVAIDLPHVPPKSLGPQEVYDQSAKLLHDWLTDGTLIRDPRPAVYAYHQMFTHAGKAYTRRMFIARVRLRPFSDGVVLPHEQTFGGPKEDRLALMKTTQANLSPIFGLYSDPGDAIGQVFAETVRRPPTVHGSLDGVDNRMWVVDDSARIAEVTRRMSDKRVYIADGHHRYGTALLYRDHMATTLGARFDDQHPANFVMFVLAGMEDPGCVILPYHRVLLHVAIDAVLAAWRPGVEKVIADRADIRLVEGNTGRTEHLRFTDRDKLRTLAPNEVPPWWQLDAAYLHRYLINELLQKATPGSVIKIDYVKSEEHARRSATEGHGVALLLNATPMAHLRAVSEAGGLMPQKSTYFHPKLATGMTINSLEG